MLGTFVAISFPLSLTTDAPWESTTRARLRLDYGFPGPSCNSPDLKAIAMTTLT